MFSGSAGTLVFVTRENGETVAIGRLDFGPGTFDDIWRFTDGNGYWGMFHSTRMDGVPGAIPNTGAYVYSIRSSAANGWRARRNGTQFATTSHSWAIRTTPQLFREGISNRNTTADLAEVAVYNRDLSDGEVHQLEQYFGTKYGITVA